MNCSSSESTAYDLIIYANSPNCSKTDTKSKKTCSSQHSDVNTNVNSYTDYLKMYIKNKLEKPPKPSKPSNKMENEIKKNDVKPVNQHYDKCETCYKQILQKLKELDCRLKEQEMLNNRRDYLRTVCVKIYTFFKNLVIYLKRFADKQRSKNNVNHIELVKCKEKCKCHCNKQCKRY